MAQDYRLVSFEKGTFQDAHGNYWCDASFAGVSEPVKWVVKDPMTVEVGKTYFGKLTEETSKAGKAYMRFRRESREEAQHTSEPKPTQEYWSDKDSAIRAQWAIGQAVQLGIASGETNARTLIDSIETTAKGLYAMVDRVKGHAIGETTATTQATGSTKNPAESIDAEFQSLVSEMNIPDFDN